MLYFSVVNPTPKHAGGGMDSPSDLPSQLDYPAIIMEQPLEEEGTVLMKFSHILIFKRIFLFWKIFAYSIVNFQLILVEDEADGEELTLTKSLKVNVLGQPRKNPVPLPTGIKGGRPGAIPNIKVDGPGQI